MGGCRCTYRNCTAKSDGQVHLFHYPVFDKLRCHQWLMNAHRLDFLDLKVSQLKNRVVCQHHFKDDNFMNYKRDKLKFDAIPTEDGPYCDSSKWKSVPVDVNKMCPIIPEDIENTQCAAYDKKTNYSLRYSDFLTNSEPSDLDINKTNHFDDVNPLLNVKKNIALKGEPICTENNNLSNISVQIENNIKPHAMMRLNKQIPIKHKGPRSMSRVKIISEKKIKDPIPIKGLFKKVSPSVTLPPPKKKSLYIPEKDKNFNGQTDNINALNNIQFDKSYVVQVEYDPSQTELDPLTLNNTAQTVIPDSSNVQYPLNDTSEIIIPDNSIVQYPMNNTSQSVIQGNSMQYPLNNTSQSVIQDSSIVQFPLNDVNITRDDTKLEITFTGATPNARIKEIPTSPQSKQLLRKIKLTPERKAAIDSKREFNKMLRNVIQACLDTKGSAENSKDSIDTNRIEEIKKQLCLQLKDTKKENKINSGPNVTVKKIKPVHQSQSILKPTVQKPNVPAETDIKNSLLTFFEARMQILESNVITRIDQNTKQISDLKEQFAKGPSKNCSTQTYENEEGYKKFLYKEISNFLSPSCNSSVYEELFINKYSVKEETVQPRAKRRR